MKLLKKQLFFTPIYFLFLTGIISVECRNSGRELPVRVALELNIGEPQEVKLTIGEVVRIKLLDINLKRQRRLRFYGGTSV